MSNNNILDEFISPQPKIDEDDEEMGDELVNGVDDANSPRCVRTLRLLSQAGITLHELIDSVMRGDKEARGLKSVVEAGSSLFKSGVLTRVLSQVRPSRPPDGKKIRGKQHKTAKYAVKKWSKNATVEVLQLELAQQAKSTQAADVESEVVNNL